MIPLIPDFMDDASYPMLRYPVIICRSLTEGLDTLEISKAKKELLGRHVHKNKRNCRVWTRDKL